MHNARVAKRIWPRCAALAINVRIARRGRLEDGKQFARGATLGRRSTSIMYMAGRFLPRS
jgi:hypothetical protein